MLLPNEEMEGFMKTPRYQRRRRTAIELRNDIIRACQEPGKIEPFYDLSDLVKQIVLRGNTAIKITWRKRMGLE